MVYKLQKKLFLGILYSSLIVYITKNIMKEKDRGLFYCF